MTAQPMDEVLARCRELAAQAPEPVTLYVGWAVMAWVRNLPRPKPTQPAVIEPFHGVPVRYDTTIEYGQWQFRNDAGEVVNEGRVGEPGDMVHYVPGKGFIACSPPPEGSWLS